MTEPTSEEVGAWAREAHLIIGEGMPDDGLRAFARAAYLAGHERGMRAALEPTSEPTVPS